jgi:hypothetical protein
MSEPNESGNSPANPPPEPVPTPPPAPVERPAIEQLDDTLIKGVRPPERETR